MKLRKFFNLFFKGNNMINGYVQLAKQYSNNYKKDIWNSKTTTEIQKYEAADTDDKVVALENVCLIMEKIDYSSRIDILDAMAKFKYYRSKANDFQQEQALLALETYILQLRISKKVKVEFLKNLHTIMKNDSRLFTKKIPGALNALFQIAGYPDLISKNNIDPAAETIHKWVKANIRNISAKYINIAQVFHLLDVSTYGIPLQSLSIN